MAMLGVLSRFRRQVELKSAKLGQDGAEMAPSWANIAPSWAKVAPRWRQDCANLGEDAALSDTSAKEGRPMRALKTLQWKAAFA